MTFAVMTRKKQTENYVNNKEFLAAITEYRHKVQKAKELGKPRPRVTNYLGECFLKIATHLSYKPNFVNYMFREDMICDGIEEKVIEPELEPKVCVAIGSYVFGIISSP